MSGSNVDLIKEKLDVVDFLRGYLTLQQSGKNFKARCPFHKEKTPSFMVSPDRQSWHCFGCGAGGDIFTFIQKIENIEFGEALKVLGEKAGLDVRNMSSPEYKYAGVLYDLNAEAKEFFKKSLNDSAPAREYLAKRKLLPETIQEFEIGWAPNSQDDLNLYLIERGYEPAQILKAGLAFKTERGLQMDRFRGRIMFPIWNNVGKVVGFTGRILPQLDRGDSGKYVNSPETPIFIKSRILYGFHKAKNFIREANAAFLVEGQMDCIMSWQAGVKNAVASSGTALTSDHLRLIRRMTENLIISFDNDDAGFEAAVRGIDMAEANDFSVKVATFAPYKDAAEAVEDGPEKLKAIVAAAMPAPEFYFQKYLGEKKTQTAADIGAVKKNLRIVLAKLKNIASPVEQSFWIKALSDRTGISEKTLIDEADKIEIKPAQETAAISEEVIASTDRKKFSRWELLAQKITGAAVATGDFAATEDDVARMPEEYGKAYKILATGAKKTDNPELDGLINLIVLQSGNTDPAELGDLRQHLNSEYVKQRRQVLSAKIREAEGRGDDSASQSAMLELQKLSNHEKK